MFSSVPAVKMPVDTFLTLKSEKPRPPKERLQWVQGFQLIWVDYPQPNIGEGVSKKFKIRIQYKDAERRIHYKTVRFGDPTDFVFNLDSVKRASRFSHLSHQNDPFHPNYWRLHLLNTFPTVQEAYKHFVNQVIDQKTLK